MRQRAGRTTVDGGGGSEGRSSPARLTSPRTNSGSAV
jgi:hypothetical protein